MSTAHILDPKAPAMIRKNGMKALIQELGVLGMKDFIRQLNPEIEITTEEVDLVLAPPPEELPPGKRPLPSGSLKGQFKMGVDIKEIDISELFRPRQVSK
jgi:hypothetical protein